MMTANRIVLIQLHPYDAVCTSPRYLSIDVHQNTHTDDNTAVPLVVQIIILRK